MMEGPAGAMGNTQDGGGEREAPSGNERESQVQSGNKIGLKRLSEYSKCIMKMIITILLASYPAKQYITSHAKPFYFKICCGLLLATFLADLLLLLLTSNSLQRGRTIGHPKISLVYFTNILAMLTSASFLLLLNISYAMLAIPLSPIIAIVGIAFHKGTNTGQSHEVTGYEAYQSELKQFFDLSALVTIDAVVGMLGAIIGYFKNFHEDVDLAPVKFSVALIFFTVIFGLLSMLLTTVPPSLHNSNSEARLITFLEVLSYALFGLLALVGLAVAAEFVDEFILLAFFHIFLALVVWFMEDERQVHRGPGGENELDNSSTAITTSIFAVMMVVYSMCFNSECDSFPLKTCMFFMSMAFVPSLSWMLLAFRPPRTEISLERVVKLLIFFTIFWLVLAMLDLIVLAIIHL